MIEKMYYCGQRDDKGHYIWPSDTGSREFDFRRDCESDAPFENLDDDRWQPRTRREGAALLTHIDGWTIFGFHDYSIDDRMGSHSTFAARGTHTVEVMEQEARRLFPDVWARFKFKVALAT
jgi:hypothetical protein